MRLFDAGYGFEYAVVFCVRAGGLFRVVLVWLLNASCYWFTFSRVVVSSFLFDCSAYLLCPLCLLAYPSRICVRPCLLGCLAYFRLFAVVGCLALLIHVSPFRRQGWREYVEEPGQPLVNPVVAPSGCTEHANIYAIYAIDSRQVCLLRSGRHLS